MKDYKRPEVLEGRTIKLNSPCGGFYLTLNSDGDALREVRMSIGKSGNCQRLLFETIAFLLSVILQSNIPKDKVLKTLLHQLSGNCGNGKSFNDGDAFHSCVDFTLTKMIEQMASHGQVQIEEEIT